MATSTEQFDKSPVPADWTTPEFGSVFSFLRTFPFSREQLTDKATNDGIRNIHYGDIHAVYENEILDMAAEPRVPYLQDGLISPEAFEDQEFPRLTDGDLVIADASEDYDGVCEAVELSDVNGVKAVGGLHTFVARSKEQAVAFGFRAYVLWHPAVVRELRRLATGISVLGISKNNLSKTRIALPPLAEQKAIARVLGLMDKAIETNNRLIAQKELRKKWLMQNLLTGKKRLSGFTKEWSTVRLTDLFERITRKNGQACTNVVTISARRGFVRQTDFFSKTIASETLDGYFLVRRGEYCYNKSYSNGYEWGATKRLNEFDEAVVTTLYICFAIKEPSRSDGDFFEQFFAANLLDHGLMRIAHEGGRAHGLLNVTPSDFFSLKVLVPDFDEQVAIAKVLQTADAEVALLRAKADKLREQKKGMMQQLLTGKKRLKTEE